MTNKKNALLNKLKKFKMISQYSIANKASIIWLKAHRTKKTFHSNFIGHSVCA